MYNVYNNSDVFATVATIDDARSYMRQCACEHMIHDGFAIISQSDNSIVLACGAFYGPSTAEDTVIVSIKAC